MLRWLKLCRSLFIGIAGIICWKICSLLVTNKHQKLNLSKVSGLTSNRILHIQLDSVGDVMMATPIFRAVKNRFVNSNEVLPQEVQPQEVQPRIDILLRPGNKLLLMNNPNINTILTLDNNILKTINTILGLRKTSYNIVIDYSSSFYSGWISFITGSKCRLGVMHNSKIGLFSIRDFGFFYTHKIKDMGMHLIDMWANEVKMLNCDGQDSRMEIYPSPKEFDKIEHLFNTINGSNEEVQPQKVIVIHPNAKWSPKRWPIDKFAKLTSELIALGYKVILVGTSRDELSLRAIASDHQTRCKRSDVIIKRSDVIIKVVTDLSLLELAALIKRADLFIGNDSGPAQISISVGTPSIVLFGPVLPARSGPKDNKHIVLFKNIGCSPCPLYYTKDKCIRGDNECLKLIEVDEVLEAVSKLIKKCS
ncbi:MAG: glycosyltransferase family 9 protein [Candidatus Stahlbacteria bacterium]|nr:glycosyltransferase family 9 protein [Candidatus Stahlbacteria bacterium]